MKITYLGHACFAIEVAEKKILIDPFIKGSPHFTESMWQKAQNADYILVTHGHGDHLGDTVELAKSSGAAVIGMPEVCGWLSTQGVEKTLLLNMGGLVLAPGIEVKMVPAIHSSSIQTASGDTICGGIACGYLVKYQNNTIYHAGDTGIFGDMKLINDLHKPNIGLLPVGGIFTMDVAEAAYACANFFSFATVIPMHYNTFPVLPRVDPATLQDSFAGTAVKVLDIGEEVQF